MKKFIDFSPVCPEAEIGMGTPRKPIRIVYKNKQIHLYQSETNIDFRKKMDTFSNNYISNIKQVDGFILKSESPSCGIKSTKIFSHKSPVPIGKRSGLFASKIIENFPNYPKEEEKRLKLNPVFLNFYTVSN